MKTYEQQILERYMPEESVELSDDYTLQDYINDEINFAFQSHNKKKFNSLMHLQNLILIHKQ